MGQLLVRNVDDALIALLKRRAARNGRSAEAEHREILREVLEVHAARASFKALLAAMPDAGDDEDFAAPHDVPREVR